MNDLSFKNWMLATELVDMGGPSENPMDMAAMMARAGGGPGAFATGTAPKKPFEGPGGPATPTPKIPKLAQDGWAGGRRQLARRLRPITPSASMISKSPSMS